MSIFAGTNGYLDDLPVEKVLPFDAEFLKYMKANKPHIGDYPQNRAAQRC